MRLIYSLVAVRVVVGFLPSLGSAKGPENASPSPLFRGWKCNRGFVRSGAQCVKLKMPEDAELDHPDNNWRCSRGYRRSGTSCVAVAIPKNAELDFTGSNWKCSRGYRRSGNGCAATAVPASASLGFTGGNWKCDASYKRVGASCLRITQEELRAQQAQMRKIFEELEKRRAAGVHGDDCESEYKNNAEVCGSIDSADLDCTKSYTGNYYTSCDASLSYTVSTELRWGGVSGS